MSEIVFRADSVTKAYRSVQVLKSATLWARSGSVTAVLGRNGCGKSTLLRIAAGLLRPDQGVILFDGQAWERPRLHILAARGLFFLPERGLLQRNMSLGAHLDAVAARFQCPQRVADVVDRLGLGDLLDRLPDSLSGGERRRGELGIVLARAPRCLLADEPFMGIAPRDAEDLTHVFRELAASGCAVVMSGHEVPLLLDSADEIIWLTSGTTHGLGAAAEARRHWQFRREYLGAQAT